MAIGKIVAIIVTSAREILLSEVSMGDGAASGKLHISLSNGTSRSLPSFWRNMLPVASDDRPVSFVKIVSAEQADFFGMHGQSIAKQMSRVGGVECFRQAHRQHFPRGAPR